MVRCWVRAQEGEDRHTHLGTETVMTTPLSLSSARVGLAVRTPGAEDEEEEASAGAGSVDAERRRQRGRE